MHKAILRDEEPHPLYAKAVRYLEYCSLGSLEAVLTEEEMEKILPHHQSNVRQKFDMPKYLKRIEGIEELIHEFDPVGKKIVEDDWMEWLKKTAILLLKKSPNVLLRACSVLADEYN